MYPPGTTYTRLSEDLVSIFSEFLWGHKWRDSQCQSGVVFVGWDSEEFEDVALEVGQLGDEDGLVWGITTHRMTLNVCEQIDYTVGHGAGSSRTK